MLQRVRQAVRRDNKPLFFAALGSIAVFAGNLQRVIADPGVLPRHVALTGLFFVLLFLAFHLFAREVGRQLTMEMNDLDGACAKVVKMFVVYKEVVKTMVGVSLTLAWLAGLLYLSEHIQASLILPVLGGLGLSALLFGMAAGFVAFVDHIHYPKEL